LGARLFYVDGQTYGKTRLKQVKFRNFDTNNILHLIPAAYLEYWSLKLTEDRCYR
jgi:hypothetical protein